MTAKKAFTMPELITVVAIIAILISLLIPALTAVRRIAKETQQKAQITTISIAVTAYKDDFGDYPPSNKSAVNAPQEDAYSGTQMLTEALVGWDLLGFHPDSVFHRDGGDGAGGEIYPASLDPVTDVDNLRARRGPYLEQVTADAFKVEELFNATGQLEADTYVLCDQFGLRRVTLADGTVVKAGSPILYYKANTASRIHNQGPPYEDNIYNVEDNLELVQLGSLTATGQAGQAHPIADSTNNYEAFYNFIADPKAPIPWPYRPDSYILISAGADGLYGTQDDICNF